MHGLPFLPHREIRPMFIRLGAQAQTEPLRSLVDYVRRQWIESQVFPPRNWCVYKQPIRTNNDIEGWHNALNRRAGSRTMRLAVLLIELLGRGEKLTAVTGGVVTITLVYTTTKLFASWEKYENNEKTAAKLLKTCSRLVSLSVAATAMISNKFPIVAEQVVVNSLTCQNTLNFYFKCL